MNRTLITLVATLTLSAGTLLAQDTPFVRGDANLDGGSDLSDGVFLLSFLFLQGSAPGCEDAADFNDSGGLDISDASFLFNTLFLGGPSIPAPAGECGEDPTVDSLTCLETDCEITDPGLPGGYRHFRENVEVEEDGARMVIRSDGVPDHPSPYFPTNDPRYIAPHAGMRVNPNRIQEQNLVFRVPANPTFAASPTDTRLGPIGVAVNGVAFYNQYARENAPLDREIISFDIYNGHPQNRGMYHYHIEPTYLTADDSGALIGYLLDGFPIYGPTEEDGSNPTGLDDCNGHTHATEDYPDGIYHYHVVPAPPYLIGCYKGQPGTFSN
jgi:hypothetical protein